MGTNTQNVIAFKSDLEKVSEKAATDIGKLIRWVALSLWEKITARTPVDTGRARASWNLAVGKPNESIPGSMGEGKGEHAGKSNPPTDPKIKFPSISKYSDYGKKPIYITSALDYMSNLESGGSNQAAGGMVRISIAEVEVEIEHTLKNL